MNFVLRVTRATCVIIFGVSALGVGSVNASPAASQPVQRVTLTPEGVLEGERADAMKPRIWLPITSAIAPEPTLTPTPTQTLTPSPGPSPTQTLTPSPGPTPTPTSTPSPGPSPTPTLTPSPGPSPTPTLTPIASSTATATRTPTATPVSGVQPTYSVITEKGDQIVLVNGPGLIVSIPQIAAGAASLAISPAPLLTQESTGIWRLNHRLRIGANTTLRVSPETVSWLKLRSDTSSATTTIDRASFVFLDTVNGSIVFSNTKVTSWDFIADAFDTTPKNGRAFVRAYGAARMDVLNSEMGYMGSPQGGGSYGLSWRDETKDANGVYVAGVTGDVIGSDIHHNYYGFFTFAAKNMTIRNNKFRDSDSYGFDPHDFSYDFLVEDNEAFNNGNHGFIISRGCYNFVFRRNKSYNNTYRVDTQSFRAHGFMVDPGGLTSDGGPYTPSYDNLFEFNEAYGNQGYGLRLLDAYTTTVRNNTFRNNLRGITVERGSFGNRIENNTIRANTESGVQLLGDDTLGNAHDNTVTGNRFEANGVEAILITRGAYRNTMSNNTMIGNPTGIRASGSGADHVWSQNTISGTTSISRAIATTSTINLGVLPPGALSVSGLTLSGTAEPGATVEVYSSPDTRSAAFFEGTATANGSGNWTLTVSAAWRGRNLTALQTVTGKGSSALATHFRLP
jgi:parallel beta-helix repeat protein